MPVIKAFPVKESPLYKWITTARYIASKNGIARANSWIKANVPDQLKQVVNKSI